MRIRRRSRSKMKRRSERKSKSEGMQRGQYNGGEEVSRTGRVG